MKHFCETREVYFELLAEMKKQVKSDNVKCHEWKLDIKDQMRRKSSADGQWSLCCFRQQIRALHIVYSLMKGRTYKQIEPKVREDSYFPWAEIESVCKKYNIPYDIIKGVINDEAIRNCA